MKILLANIGNRNITFRNKTHNSKVNELTFRDWTQDILKRYEQLKHDLDINIINPLVDREDRPAKIILFYSDQSKLNTRTDQDTIFEAQLLKNILHDKYSYPKDSIQLIHVNCKVIDNGALTSFYRKSLFEIKRNNQYDRLTICDAGGTAQQKMALKIMAEFVLDEAEYEVKYVERNKWISVVNLDEYRGVISTEQAIKLIHHGQYTAASELLDYQAIDLFHLTNEWKKKVYAHVYFRYIGNTKMAQQNVMGLRRIKNVHLKNYKQKMLDFESKGLEKVWSMEKLFKLTDYLHKAEFLFQIGQYSHSVLSFAQFYEYLLDQNLLSIFGKKKLKKINAGNEVTLSEFRKYLVDNCKREIEVCEGRYEDYTLVGNSLAIKCIIAKNSKLEIIRKVAGLLSVHIDYTDDASDEYGYINKLRNKVAHNGLFLTQSDMRDGQVASFYEELLLSVIKVFQFRNGNPFTDLNTIIEQLLRQ